MTCSPGVINASEYRSGCLAFAELRQPIIIISLMAVRQIRLHQFLFRLLGNGATRLFAMTPSSSHVTFEPRTRQTFQAWSKD